MKPFFAQSRTAACWVITIVALLMSGCSRRPPGELSQVELLSIRLHSLGYVRTLDEFRYTLTYQAVPPSKVIVRLNHPSDMSTALVMRVSDSAKGAVERMGKEQFDIPGLQVEIQTGLLTPEELQRLRSANAKSNPSSQN